MAIDLPVTTVAGATVDANTSPDRLRRRPRVARSVAVAGRRWMKTLSGVVPRGQLLRTGHSSLSYLRQLPVDILKIDRSFVAELPAAAGRQTIAAVVVSLARSLGMRTVGEGVEDDGQLSGLLAAGCDEAQGFLFARPLPPEQTAELLASGPLKHATSAHDRRSAQPRAGRLRAGPSAHGRRVNVAG